MDVDRRYFNNNAGLGYGANYAVINVKPGYQKMCGTKALDYVRYRHTDNDIVRAARQQDFLRQVRSQVSARQLFDKIGKLINIFADNTASDIDSTSALRRLRAAGAGRGEQADQAGEVPRPLGPSYVYASPGPDPGRRQSRRHRIFCERDELNMDCRGASRTFFYSNDLTQRMADISQT